MVNHLSRLAARFYEDEAQHSSLRNRIETKLPAREALEAGLVTSAPDDLDWEDEIRQAIESRAAQSPDALSGLEANLRFGPPESLEAAFLAGFPPGRTGFSFAPTPWEQTVP